MRCLFLAILLSAMSATAAKANLCYVREYTSEHMAKHPSQTIRLLRVHFITEGDVIAFLMGQFRGSNTRYFDDLTCEEPPWDANGLTFCASPNGSVVLKGIGTDSLMVYSKGAVLTAPGTGEPLDIVDRYQVETIFKLSRVIEEFCRR